MRFVDVAQAGQSLAQLRPLPDLTPVDPSQFTGIEDVLLLIIQGLLILASILVVMYIIWSGFTFITSAGDPARAEKARNGLIYAVIGMIVIAFSVAIVNIVSDVVTSEAPTECQPLQPGQPPQPC